MTRMETSRVREVLALHIGAIREHAVSLDENDFEKMEQDLLALEIAVKEAKSLVDGLPHKPQK